MKFSRSAYYLITCLAGALALSALSSDVYASKSATKVMVKEVAMNTVSDRLEALGNLRALESVSLTVNATETVSEILFDDAQRVKKGDILVKMEAAEERALLQEAKYTLDESERQLNRILKLANRGDAAQSLLDERQREYNVAKSRLIAIESRIQDRVISAPFSGIVGLRNLSPGALIETGDVIATLVDDSAMKLDFNVPSLFLRSIKPGQRITAIATALGDQEFIGEVKSLDNQIDPVSRSITIRALIPNGDKLLKPGLLMEVELHTNQRQAMTIPEEALIPLSKSNFVYLVKENEDTLLAERVDVEIGSRWRGEVEILKGISPGDRVIIHGTSKVKPGSEVTIIEHFSAGNK